jgi:hypothetical protein
VEEGAAVGERALDRREEPPIAREHALQPIGMIPEIPATSFQLADGDGELCGGGDSDQDGSMEVDFH